MKVLIDTSVIVAALIDYHPEHKKSVSWLQKAINKKNTGIYICPLSG
jgi:predicted nucleic acid-binding protein